MSFFKDVENHILKNILPEVLSSHKTKYSYPILTGGHVFAHYTKLKDYEGDIDIKFVLNNFDLKESENNMNTKDIFVTHKKRVDLLNDIKDRLSLKYPKYDFYLVDDNKPIKEYSWRVTLQVNDQKSKQNSIIIDTGILCNLYKPFNEYYCSFCGDKYWEHVDVVMINNIPSVSKHWMFMDTLIMIFNIMKLYEKDPSQFWKLKLIKFYSRYILFYKTIQKESKNKVYIEMYKKFTNVVSEYMKGESVMKRKIDQYLKTISDIAKKDTNFNLMKTFISMSEPKIHELNLLYSKLIADKKNITKSTTLPYEELCNIYDKYKKQFDIDLVNNSLIFNINKTNHLTLFMSPFCLA